MTANHPNGVADNQPPPQQHILDVMSTGHIRVALVGNVDAGKSTVAATLIRGQLDDGNGSNRTLIAKHKHEIETGRTSSIATHLLGIDAHGDTIAVSKTRLKSRPEAYIAPRALRTVSLMDLAGHERYFKTTVAGFARGAIDYAMVIVSAAQPPTHMTQKHLHLCQMCGVQTVVVLTKTDSCPSPDALRRTQQRVHEMIRNPLSDKRPYATGSAKDVETVTNKLHALVPVLKISCVTGEGLGVLRQLLASIPRRRKHEKKAGKPLEFLVEETLNVAGVGTVLSGFVNMGQYKRGDPIVLGPCKDGTYIQTVAKSLHVAQTSVDRVTAGHSACLAVSLSKAERRMLSRNGMVILNGNNKRPPSSATSSKTFRAEICLVRGAPNTVSL